MKYYPYPKTDPVKDYIPIPKQITKLGLNSGEIAVIERSRLKCGVFPHLLLRTAEPTVWGFYEKVRPFIMGSCRKE